MFELLNRIDNNTSKQAILSSIFLAPFLAVGISVLYKYSYAHLYKSKIRLYYKLWFTSAFFAQVVTYCVFKVYYLKQEISPKNKNIDLNYVLGDYYNLVERKNDDFRSLTSLLIKNKISLYKTKKKRLENFKKKLKIDYLDDVNDLDELSVNEVIEVDNDNINKSNKNKNKYTNEKNVIFNKDKSTNVYSFYKMINEYRLKLFGRKNKKGNI